MSCRHKSCSRQNAFTLCPLRACSETSLRHFIQAFFERLVMSQHCNATRILGSPYWTTLVTTGEDYKWRILVYPHFEANFILKEGHWQYDFMSGGNGRVLPDVSMVTRPVGIKLPCQP
jgi:hypothetical protein